ncbi:unnamed protein product [Prorocentrum cordatum]|uniref:Solute carrier family 40 protein n=1 Tax=Prorocentrum cordatum TaxID=2364126 RepID=A0ABN9QJ23_9DINO|nr:unnamed protein product [Polarella glacialis]
MAEEAGGRRAACRGGQPHAPSAPARRRPRARRQRQRLLRHGLLPAAACCACCALPAVGPPGQGPALRQARAFVAFRAARAAGRRPAHRARSAGGGGGVGEDEAKRREALRLGDSGPPTAEEEAKAGPLGALGEEGLFDGEKARDPEAAAWPRGVPASPEQIMDAKGPGVALFLAFVAASWLYMGQFIGFQNALALLVALASVDICTEPAVGEVVGRRGRPPRPGRGRDQPAGPGRLRVHQRPVAGLLQFPLRLHARRARGSFVCLFVCVFCSCGRLAGRARERERERESRAGQREGRAGQRSLLARLGLDPGLVDQWTSRPLGDRRFGRRLWSAASGAWQAALRARLASRAGAPEAPS